MDNQEFNGFWGGKAAAMLGFEGTLTEQAFSRLCHNLHPQTGEQLTARMQADRRSGWDITFDVPKSVSLAWAYTQDDRIIRAVREAMAELRDKIEMAAATRVRAGLEKMPMVIAPPEISQRRNWFT